MLRRPALRQLRRLILVQSCRRAAGQVQGAFTCRLNMHPARLYAIVQSLSSLSRQLCNGHKFKEQLANGSAAQDSRVLLAALRCVAR